MIEPIFSWNCFLIKLIRSCISQNLSNLNQTIFWHHLLFFLLFFTLLSSLLFFNIDLFLNVFRVFLRKLICFNLKIFRWNFISFIIFRRFFLSRSSSSVIFFLGDSYFWFSSVRCWFGWFYIWFFLSLHICIILKWILLFDHTA